MKNQSRSKAKNIIKNEKNQKNNIDLVKYNKALEQYLNSDLCMKENKIQQPQGEFIDQLCSPVEFA